MTERAPYRVWSLYCPFTKAGFPVVGNFGNRIHGVVVMEAETFKRLVAENPELATAQFEMGTLE